MDSLSKVRWLRFFAFIPSVAMAFMDQSILSVALPDIQKEFHASNAVLMWSVNSYLLAITIFFLFGGKIGALIGTRKAYLYGMAIFTCFSALCSLSPSIEFLCVARAFQGVGAGIMVPSQVALVAEMFPVQIRGRVFGLITSCASLFLIIAPSIGGYLTETLSWRWIFWINLPIATIGILLVLLLIPATAGGKGKIDWIGFVYFSSVCTLITILFMQGPSWGWRSKQILFCALFAIISVVLLLRREKKTEYPILDLALFKRKIFGAINISICITQFVLMITVFRTIYIENILGYTPLQAGLIISISSIPILFLAPLGGFLSDKIGPRLPLFIGYVCLIASFFWLGFFSAPQLPSLFIALLLFGMGIPLIFTPSFTTAISSIEPEKLGTALGMVYTLRTLASTMGLSLIFVFVDLEQKFHAAMGQRLAEIKGFSAVHLILGSLLMIAFITAFALHQRKSAHHLPSSPAEGWD
jgi:EmrB/QacA subfamily drug resistance transporter